MAQVGSPTAAPAVTPQMAKRAALGSFVGAVVEWYDFLIYTVVAALVFGNQFFPSMNPTLSQMAGFATFAIGFVFRPLGGAFFGESMFSRARDASKVALVALVEEVRRG